MAEAARWGFGMLRVRNSGNGLPAHPRGTLEKREVVDPRGMKPRVQLGAELTRRVLRALRD